MGTASHRIPRFHPHSGGETIQGWGHCGHFSNSAYHRQGHEWDCSPKQFGRGQMCEFRHSAVDQRVVNDLSPRKVKAAAEPKLETTAGLFVLCVCGVGEAA